MNNSFTLSFNGVDFRLVPTQNNNNKNSQNDKSGVSVLQNADGQFSMIKLQSFSGTLYVSEQLQNNITPPLDVNNVKEIPNPTQKSLATVEDEELPSPQKDETKLNKKVEQPKMKGQQQLTFERKKRVNSNDDTKKSTKKIKSNKSVTICTQNDVEKEKHQVKKVSPLQMGQSSMLSDSSDHSDSESDGDFVPPESPSDENTPVKDIQLTRKPSIQELVHQAEDLTQTQKIDEFDDMLSLDNNNMGLNENSIVEFDERDLDEKEDYFERDNDNENSTTVGEEESVQKQVKIDPNIPSPRWGSTMTLIDNSKLLVYGGQGYDTKTNNVTNFSDLHVYDLKKKTWRKPVDCEGMPRTWHTSTFLPDRSLVISFGGERYNPKTKKTQTTDQVMVLDTEIMLWYPPSVSGQVPSGRSGHTASLLPSTNELVVFGGVKNNKWQNSLAVLDTMRWKWMSPKIAGDAPRARSYHSATPVPSMEKEGSMLVIFGGNNETECFNTVHVLDTTSEDGKWSWFHPNVAGKAPSARTGHCAVLLEDQKTILIYGGWDPNDEDEDCSDEKMICGDSFLLDTEAWTWKPGPSPKFINQGGAENGGKKRTGASALLAPGEDLSQVLVFGGRVPNEKFANDFQSMIVPQRMIDVKLN